MAATKQAWEVEGLLLLQIYTGDLRVHMCGFGVVTLLVVQLLLGMCFMAWFMKAILPI